MNSSSSRNANKSPSGKRQSDGKSLALSRLFNLVVCKNDSIEIETIGSDAEKLFDWESLIKSESKKSNNSYSYSFPSNSYSSQFNNQIVSLIADFESNLSEIFNAKSLKVNV
jgi:hypothetical protein